MIAPLGPLAAVLLVALPLVLAVMAYLVRRGMGLLVVWVGPCAMAAGALTLMVAVVQGGDFRYTLGGWDPPLGIVWRIDGLAVVMLMVTVIVFSATCVFAPAYFAGETHTTRRTSGDVYWPLVYTLWAALNALFMTADLFNVYVTLELLTLASLGLIVLTGQAEAIAAALRYLLWALMASLIYLLGVAFLYANHGVLDIGLLASVARPDPLTAIGLTLLVVGLMIKTALFPMHFWLPPAHAAAPAPASALLSGLVVKGSFCIVLRLWFEVFHAVGMVAISPLFGLLGLGAILWGAPLALFATRLKAMVAYSTVAQLGYLFLAFPITTDPAVASSARAGIVIFAVSHALAKSAFFLAAGRMRHVVGDDRMTRYVGIGQRTPMAITATALAGISLMGLPPSGGFAGKWMLLTAAFHSGQWWWGLIVVLGGLLTASYLFRFWALAIRKTDPPSTREPMSGRLDIPPLLLAMAAVAVMAISAPIAAVVDIGAPAWIVEEGSP